ncbi:MAG: aromatic amino acid lyase [Gammaproteobacteria bacterium]|nr:aromatic amino acid lyase [Gammaproteobacteria bacterium]
MRSKPSASDSVSAKPAAEQQPISIGGRALTIEDVIAIARRRCSVALSREPAFVERIRHSAAFLDEVLASGGTVYGVNTGYGDSCSVEIPRHLVAELPHHLVRYHGCGLGAYLDEESALAVLAARLNSLSQGYSGVRWVLLERLAQLINDRILPRIPCEGSVGASGDLTPLSYVAATLIGEREVIHGGRVRPAAQVWAERGVTPLTLAPKEGLAIMNGTAVMTALACLAWDRAQYLTRLSARLTSLAALGMRGNRDHFHPKLFAAKPHRGQAEIAEWIYADMAVTGPNGNGARLQDRYSIRCAPHVIGVLRDALPWMRRDLENELNSANDNPLVDADERLVLHGGHFYGGHIAFVMDAMKTAVASVADLMDRQMALLVDGKFNHGLPQNLSGASPERAPINHGFKAVQISVSAWTAEALKLTMPATAFSRSTESHNQDKVSMGTIAARDCLRVLELTEQVAAAMMLATYQGILLRERQGELNRSALTPEVRSFLEGTRLHFEFLEEDRRLDETLLFFVEAIRAQAWSLYP